MPLLQESSVHDQGKFVIYSAAGTPVVGARFAVECYYIRRRYLCAVACAKQEIESTKASDHGCHMSKSKIHRY